MKINKIISFVETRLTIAPLLVFLIGAPLIILTRVIFHIYHPEYFVNRLPSISKTAAFAPGSYLFSLGMILVSLCILISWTYIYQLNRDRIRQLSFNNNSYVLLHLKNVTASILGISAGIFLGLLSVISLDIDDPLHISLSILFFNCQILSFIFDTLCALAIIKIASLHNIEIENLTLSGKPYVCVTITLASIFFLFMYLAKDSTIFTDKYFAQKLYITAEYSTSLLAFSYSALYYPEINAHFNKVETVIDEDGELNKSKNYI